MQRVLPTPDLLPQKTVYCTTLEGEVEVRSHSQGAQSLSRTFSVCNVLREMPAGTACRHQRPLHGTDTRGLTWTPESGRYMRQR